MRLRWHCLICKNTWEDVYVGGERKNLTEIVEAAMLGKEGAVGVVSLYCPQCDRVVGTAQIPPAAAFILVDGDATIFYSFEPLKEEEATVVREIPVKTNESENAGRETT